ncbi:hypothetical protein N0B51_10670 [Tsuneonella sp. YG55]|uniref:Uncharacterized protein n=1 Tax=Tsuneonella litorea TaxID=2976475 RepID=A0A9X3AN99_9SPHN|nr:hypothetical protein [Tsuneonella litorea]MCT2559442.1 hypothetical protein [Tsuneonella litorea]
MAIAARKGGPLHRRSGQLFAASMGFAAATACIFALQLGEIATAVSGLTALYGIGMGILTVRRRTGLLRALSWILAALAALLSLFAVGSLVMGLVQGAGAGSPGAFVPFALGLAVLGMLYGALALGDWQFLRQGAVARTRRLRRHAVRFALAATEIVRAPLITFAPPVFGEATFPAYFFGPLILIPFIAYFALPGWLRHEEAPPRWVRPDRDAAA